MKTTAWVMIRYSPHHTHGSDDDRHERIWSCFLVRCWERSRAPQRWPCRTSPKLAPFLPASSITHGSLCEVRKELQQSTDANNTGCRSAGKTDKNILRTNIRNLNNNHYFLTSTWNISYASRCITYFLTIIRFLLPFTCWICKYLSDPLQRWLTSSIRFLIMSTFSLLHYNILSRSWWFVVFIHCT